MKNIYSRNDQPNAKGKMEIFRYFDGDTAIIQPSLAATVNQRYPFIHSLQCRQHILIKSWIWNFFVIGVEWLEEQFEDSMQRQTARISKFSQLFHWQNDCIKGSINRPFW